MTELVNHATERSNDAAACAIKLLHHYGFDLGGYTLSKLLIDWQQHYPTAWIRLATIEALYQGRYKAISVEQILAMWQRRSQPLPHFNHEFERLVCDNLPDHQVGSTASSQSESPLSRSTPLSTQALPYRAALQLPHFERAPLPEADVMLALRTLHSKEMAALQEAALLQAAQPEAAQPEAVQPDAAQPDAAQTTQTPDPPPTQTYSYSLRSEDSSAPTTIPDPSTNPEPREADLLIPSVETLSLEGVKGEEVDLQESLSESTAIGETSVTNAVSIEALLPPPGSSLDNKPASQTTEPVPSTALTDDAQMLPLPPIGAIAKILQQLEHQEIKATTELSSLGLVAPALKPKLQLHLPPPYQPTWLTDPSRKQPIHQFTPIPEPSDFHSKLKAVAQPLEEPQEE